MTDAVDDAIRAFSQGKPVMVFDSDFREKETDYFGQQRLQLQQL